MTGAALAAGFTAVVIALAAASHHLRHRWPDLGGRIVAALFIVVIAALIMTIARGELLRPGHIDAEPDGGCGQAIAC